MKGVIFHAFFYFYFRSFLTPSISDLKFFYGAFSRFPLYLLFRFATQKDVASIGARNNIQKENQFIN